MTDEKVFYSPGDIVTIKQDIDNKPLMIVKSVDKATIRRGLADREGSKPTLFGITCFWFTSEGFHQETRFNTKDLIHVA